MTHKIGTTLMKREKDLPSVLLIIQQPGKTTE